MSDCSDVSCPELAVLEQPSGTLITSAGTESRVLREAGSSTGGAANRYLLVIPQAAALVVPQAVVFLVRPHFLRWQNSLVRNGHF